MSYKLIFDVQTDGLRLFWLILLPLSEFFFAFVLAGALLLERHTGRKLTLWKSAIPAALVKALLVLATAAITWDYVRLTWLLESGGCVVVEGTVKDFRPMPKGGHDQESFSVSGVRFAYGDLRAGYDKTAPEGGHIRDGQHVRIHYFPSRLMDNEIARLEVAEGDIN